MDELSQLLKAINNRLSDGMSISGGKIRVSLPSIHEAEWRIISTAGKKRQREFSWGRIQAHEALKKMDRDVDSILKGGRGEPLWPQGIIGSITHTNEYCAAMVCNQGPIQSIGIDMEETGRMNKNLWPKLFTGNEVTALNKIANPANQQKHAAVIFSAKEALYKCLNPVLERYIGFEDVEVHLTAAHEIKFDHGCDLNGKEVAGYYSVSATHVITTVLLR